MTDTVSSTTQVLKEQQHQQQEHASSDECKDLADVHKILCETTETVFKVMTERPKDCQAPHVALIHLTGFNKPELDMVMSVCGEKDAKKWHQVYWTRKNPSNGLAKTQSLTESICSALKESRKYKRLLRIHLQHDGTWLPSIADRMKRYAIAPERTLEDLLNAKQNGGGANEDLTKLQKKDKLDLAVAIARSLLYLLGSPLLQGTWKTGTIYVAQTINEANDCGLRTKPYISRELNKELSKDGSGDSANGSSYILHLGVLLWELLFGRKIIITPEDVDCEDEEDQDLSLFNALSREENNSRESFFEEPCLDIIANCLNLYPETKLDDQAFRMTMYGQIVKPLEGCLKSYSPEKQPSAVDRNESTRPSLRSIPGKSHPESGLSSHVRMGLQGSMNKAPVVNGAISVTRQPRTSSSLGATFSDSDLLASNGNVRDRASL